MSATQELIAAALTACDVAATDYEGAYRAKRDLREACASAMVQPDGWKPIESAPKDGTSVLLATALSYADGYWLQSAYNGNGAWIWPYAYKEPRYWMPLLRTPK